MVNNQISGNPLPPTLENQTEYITTTSEKFERTEIIVGREDSPNGLRKFYVSRPHVENLSARWYEAIQRNTHRTRFRKWRITKQIHFPDDDADAMRLFLYIAHVQPTKLPRSLTVDELVQLALVAERYDLSSLLIGHLERWVAPHRRRILEPGYEEWLYVAWYFRAEDDYLRLATHLAKNCSVNDEGQLLVPNTDRPLTSYVPEHVLDAIQTTRLKAIITLLQIASLLVYDMLHGENITCQIADATPEQRLCCTSRNHLGLQRYLSLNAFYPPLTDEDVVHIQQPVSLIAQLLSDTEGIAKIMKRPDDSGSLEVFPVSMAEMLDPHKDVCRIEDELARKIHHAMYNMCWEEDLKPIYK